ncbi:MAG: hypothetical protein V1792_04610 [Pseudomonadota bacterium]
MNGKKKKLGQKKRSGHGQLRAMDFKSTQSDVIREIREQAKKISAAMGLTGNIDRILEQAKKIALEAKETDSNISKIYWFPHEEEVRLIEIDENTVESLCGCVEPFYFDSTAEVPVPSGIAIIRADEFGKLEMPNGWGDWKDGQELVVGE